MNWNQKILFLSSLVLLSACATTPKQPTQSLEPTVQAPEKKDTTVSAVTSGKNEDQTVQKSVVKHALYQTEAIATFTAKDLDSYYTKIFCNNLEPNSRKCLENMKSIQKISGFEGFDLARHPIANNPFQLEEIQALKFKYQTKGVFGDLRNVSGAVLVPKMDPAQFRGVVLFFHPTLLSKFNVPSYSSENHILKLLASVFASQGYVVATPDYVGMGDDNKVPHPYVAYPKVNTDDGMALLQTVRHYLDEEGAVLEGKPLDLFVASYSEGGGYALWFNRLAQEQDENAGYKKALASAGYKLRHTAGISGAYDYSGLATEWFFQNTTTDHPKYSISSNILSTASKASLIANFLISYGYYHEHYTKEEQYKQILNPDFFDMKCDTFVFGCKLNGQQYNLLSIFSAKAKEPEIGLAIFNAARGKKAEGGRQYRLFPSVWNSGLSLVSHDFSKDETFHAFLKSVDIASGWSPKTPLTLIYLKQDSIVTNLHSKIAYDHLRNKDIDKSTQSNVETVEFDTDMLEDVRPKVDHVKGMDYLMIPALLKFNQDVTHTNKND